MLQVLLTESHPETTLFDGGVVLHQTLQLLVVQQIAFAWTDVGIGEGLVNLQWFCLNPLTILIVKSLLGNLADINLRVEVRGEGMVVVTSITVHDVEVMDLVEVVLGGIGRIDTRYTWVEATTQDRCETSLFETVLVSPLPGILKVCFVLRLVVGRIEIVTTAGQTSVHDRQVLIGQGEVNHELRLIVREERLQLLHIVGIHLSSLDVHVVASFVDVGYNLVALGLAAAGDHKFGKHVCILCDLECCYRGDASSANH